MRRGDQGHLTDAMQNSEIEKGYYATKRKMDYDGSNRGREAE